MITPSSVPPIGPLLRDATYVRDEIHARFGGTKYKGIVSSPTEPAVLLFHSSEASQQFYGDGLDEDGIYSYSGMGQRGDMEWGAENRAIRDHQDDGRDLLFFERAQRKGGLWRFCGEMQCVGHRVEKRPDSDGKDRAAIIFELVPLPDSGPVDDAPLDFTGLDLNALRALAAAPGKPTTRKQAASDVRLRSAAVKLYALARAGGTCEACGQPGPFISTSGRPFLEVHHLHRLADNGPDLPDAVAAICPNCHRRCHYGQDRVGFNGALIRAIKEKERSDEPEGSVAPFPGG